jgi:hypothetical protein
MDLKKYISPDMLHSSRINSGVKAALLNKNLGEVSYISASVTDECGASVE